MATVKDEVTPSHLDKTESSKSAKVKEVDLNDPDRVRSISDRKKKELARIKKA